MSTTTAEGFITVREAATALGLTERTLNRRLERGTVRVYRDGRDHRRRVLMVDDLPKLVEPGPWRPGRREREEVPADVA